MRWPEESAHPHRRATPPLPSPVADLVAGLVSAKRWHARLEGAQVHHRWAEIAGAQLAEHTEPVRLVGGVLVVRASSPAWATQVHYLAAQLAERANAVLGPGQVTKVTVTTGSQEPRKGR